MAPTTWLITGASSGIGEELALKAVSAGDHVIATSRSLPRLDKLKAKGAAVLALDHNQSFSDVKTAVEEALKLAPNGIDIVVNNAAYVHLGMLEETTPEETLVQFQSNVFGPLNVYRAILPQLRARRSGILVTIGSMAAWYPMPGCNLYNASKAALRTMAIGLEGEISSFGLKHCLIEPGFFRTQLLSPQGNLTMGGGGGKLGDYNDLNATSNENLAAFHGQQLGNPKKGAEIIFDVLKGTGVAKGREVPAFLPLGSDACEEISKAARKTLEDISAWKEVAAMSDYPAESA